ncbi:MAG: hypothetical protein HY710_01650 [Candidatus Latescibacteria bacterium]|nr:hypothetical protein [Candidatus Latescibacterota bacterium]
MKTVTIETEIPSNRMLTLELPLEVPTGKATVIIQVQNREDCLRLLDEWYATPDDKGVEWWDKFEQDLKQNRLRLHELD